MKVHPSLISVNVVGVVQKYVQMLSSSHSYCPWDGNPSPEKFLSIVPIPYKDFSSRLLNILVSPGVEKVPKLDQDFVSNMVRQHRIKLTLKMNVHSEFIESLVTKFIKLNPDVAQDKSQVIFATLHPNNIKIITGVLYIITGWISNSGCLSCDICQRSLQIEYYKNAGSIDTSKVTSPSDPSESSLEAPAPNTLDSNEDASSRKRSSISACEGTPPAKRSKVEK